MIKNKEKFIKYMTAYREIYFGLSKVNEILNGGYIYGDAGINEAINWWLDMFIEDFKFDTSEVENSFYEEFFTMVGDKDVSIEEIWEVYSKHLPK